MAFVAFKKTRMREAIETNNIAQMKVLLDKGVSPNLADDYGTGFLFYAVEIGNRDAVRLLIERGASVEDYSTYRGTCLHAAALNGSVEIAQLLLDKTPKLINVKNRSGSTALHIAAKKGHVDMAALLISKGADTEEKNHENRTALFFAQHERHEDMIKLLKPYQKVFAPILPLPAAAAAELLRQKDAQDEWKKLGAEKIARVTIERSIGYRLTEIFNFKTRERTQIYSNLETKSETTETKGFADIAEKQPLEEALTELHKRGGTGSLNSLQKTKPPTQGRI